MLRIGLFLLTNIAIMIVAGITLSLLGIDSMLQNNGVDLDLRALLIMSAVFGMAGSFISLLMSKWLAKRAAKVEIIDQPRNQKQQWLMRIVAKQAQQAGIKMPEVGIFPQQQANAFATGWNRNNALVAISSGMLERFADDEIEAVLGHEIGHVANGDMITLTLIQGIVNTFVIFFSRVIGHFIDRVILKNERGHGMGYFLGSLFAQIVLSILASAITMWFSRIREYRADQAGARLGSKQGMIRALQRLQKESQQPSQMPDELLAFGISSGKGNGIRELFSSHPPLEKRIAELQKE
ncbi:protease HtpX [Alteromonadaceae bacterium BrNp21-10]|nr:protease HtpX [Alteromonadaceae bacterium BrNp21-10]